MNVQEMMLGAATSYGKGDWATAEQQYRAVLRAAPRFAEAHYQLACVLHRVGKINEAITSANFALDIAPRDARCFNFLGVCYLYRNEPPAAELCFRRAIELQPDYADALNNFGVSLLNQQRHDEAEPVLTRAVELAPNDVNTLCNMARLLRDREKYEQALALYDRGMQLQSQNPNSLIGKITCLERIGRTAEALALAESAPALPRDKEAEMLGLKAVLLNISGRLDEACAAVERGLALNPASIELLSTRVHMRKVDAAEPFFPLLQNFEARVATLTGSTKIQACYMLGKAYQDVGDMAKAAQYFAEGGANVLHSLDYDEKNELELFAANKRNLTGPYLNKLAAGGSDSERPIFILGMERSGTTLIEQILGSHPDVFPGGELSYASSVLSGFMLPEGIQYKVDGGEKFDANTSMVERAQAYQKLIDALPGSEGRLRITDKMPDNFKNLGLIYAMFPHARIIHCRRDPVDNCISSYTTHFASGTQWSFDLAMMGRRYRAYWELMAHWRQALPGKFLEVRYEQVVGDTEQAARTLLDWCGLKWDDRVLRFYETDRPVRTASVTQVRQPIYKTSMGRWKKWEPYIQPLLAEIGEIEKQYWAELG